MMQAGDPAQMMIEDGPHKGIWLPITVVNRKASGQYRVRIMVGEAAHDIIGISGDIIRKAIKGHVEKPTEELVLQLKRESMRRAKKVWLDMGFNKSEASRKVQESERVLLKLVEQEARDAGCPTGFSLAMESLIKQPDL